MPRELPILMGPEMVKALIEGRKTQTRRIEGLKILNDRPYIAWKFTGWLDNGSAQFDGKSVFEQIKPRYQVGDILRIKGTDIRLRVTAVKDPHQIQNISEEDAIAEGIDAAGCCRCSMDEYIEGVRFCGKCNKPFLDVDVEFGSLWNRLHSHPGERFEDFPWVFPYVIERFER